MRLLITIFCMFVWMGSAPASAQFGEPGGLGDILEDILKQGKDTPESENLGQIDNIPVSITIEGEPDFKDQILIVTAFMPPEQNGTFVKPVMLGQTHLRLTGLRAPLNIVVAVPSPITDTIDFARIEARTIDANGNTVLSSRADGIFRGSEPAKIALASVNQPPVSSEQSASISGVETVQGRIALADSAAVFRGSMLTVQLVERGLAGRLTTNIAAETLIDIDQKSAPFDFALDRVVRQDGKDVDLALNAWITDWAGRKTHVMETPVPYNGPDNAYRLTLESYSASAPPAENTDTGGPQTIVKGEARFDAYKGLPAGSELTATLNRATGAPGTTRALATRTILLDGLSGDISFDLITDKANLDTQLPPPLLNVRITSASGHLFFSAANFPVQDGLNIVHLVPGAAY